MLEATKGIAQVASQLGASAMAAVSASAHIGHGESRSDSASISNQNVSQNGRMDGLHVNHNHQYIHD